MLNGDITIGQNEGTMREQGRNLRGTMEGDLKQDINKIVNKLFNKVINNIKEDTVIFQTLTPQHNIYEITEYIFLGF